MEGNEAEWLKYKVPNDFYDQTVSQGLLLSNSNDTRGKIAASDSSEIQIGKPDMIIHSSNYKRRNFCPDRCVVESWTLEAFNSNPDFFAGREFDINRITWWRCSCTVDLVEHPHAWSQRTWPGLLGYRTCSVMASALGRDSWYRFEFFQL